MSIASHVISKDELLRMLEKRLSSLHLNSGELATFDLYEKDQTFSLKKARVSIASRTETLANPLFLDPRLSF